MSQRHAAERDILILTRSLRSAIGDLNKHHRSNDGEYFWTRDTQYYLRQRLWRIDRVLGDLKKPVYKRFGSQSGYARHRAELHGWVYLWLIRPTEFLSMSTGAYAANLRLIADNSVEFARDLERELEGGPL